jgi:hypothetical protein
MTASSEVTVLDRVMASLSDLSHGACCSIVPLSACVQSVGACVRDRDGAPEISSSAARTELQVAVKAAKHSVTLERAAGESSSGMAVSTCTWVLARISTCKSTAHVRHTDIIVGIGIWPLGVKGDNVTSATLMSVRWCARVTPQPWCGCCWC